MYGFSERVFIHGDSGSFAEAVLLRRKYAIKKDAARARRR